VLLLLLRAGSVGAAALVGWAFGLGQFGFGLSWISESFYVDPDKFGALAIAVCVWLTFMMCQAANRVEAVAYGAIIGGAFGNVTDRLRFQGVTDFLDFYVSTAHWPAFNMADVFVVCGVGLLLIGPKVTPSLRKYVRLNPGAIGTLARRDSAFATTIAFVT